MKMLKSVARIEVNGRREEDQGGQGTRGRYEVHRRTASGSGQAGDMGRQGGRGLEEKESLRKAVEDSPAPAGMTHEVASLRVEHLRSAQPETAFPSLITLSGGLASL